MEESRFIQDTTDKISQGKLDAAVEIVDNGLEHYQQSAQLHFLRAAISAQLEDYALAIQHYQKSLEYLPGLSIARFQLGLLFATLGENDDAKEVLSELCTQDENYLSCFSKGIIFLLHEQPDEAITLIENGMAINLENVSLNNDMKAMLSRIKQQTATTQNSDTSLDAEVDQTHLLDIYHSRH